jgi:hypothetical protein
MTQQELWDFFMLAGRVLRNVFAVIGLLVVVAVLGYTSGKDKQQQVSARCINSTCDQPCKPGARFTRHTGECK